MADSIIIDNKGSVRFITLNRPYAFNSFDREMGAAFQQALDDAGYVWALTSPYCFANYNSRKAGYEYLKNNQSPKEQGCLVVLILIVVPRGQNFMMVG